MDLTSGYPYFFIKNGLCQDFNVLQTDHVTDVVVLGGGISGALMAYQLVKNGIECTVIDKRKIGLGSTSASTCLLQYEIDVALHQLIKQIGSEKAQMAYKLCGEAVDRIYEIALDIGYEDFVYCNSIYFSHTSKKNSFLQKEFESRKDAGFAVHYLNETELLAQYKLKSKEAIVSEKAGKIDAYRFTYLLHQYNLKRGSLVFENTTVEKTIEDENGITLLTGNGRIIKAKKIIYATGYEATEQINKSIVMLRSTYAFVTERIHSLPSFFKNNIFWNTADPYLYIREDEGRLIIGGRDDKNYDPAKRALILEKKAKDLKEDFRKLFPQIKINNAFTWAGVFGSTKDGLPYIGEYSKKPNSYFALGFGGNGITFSALAADLIVKHIKDKKNIIPEMFSFNR